MAWTDWVIQAATSTGLASLVVVAVVQRLLDRRVERLKATLLHETQEKIERLKADLQREAQKDVEHLRSTLNARNEVLRHEIEKQRLRAQLATTKVHTVYSDLIKHLRIAEGAIGGLSGGFLPTYEKHSIDDIRKVLQQAKTPELEEQEVLDALRADRELGLDLLREVMRRKEIRDARREHSEAKNQLVLEGIFMTARVRDLAWKASTALAGAVAAMDTANRAGDSSELYKSYVQHCEEARTALALLEDAMRADLLPEQVSPPAAASGQAPSGNAGDASGARLFVNT